MYFLWQFPSQIVGKSFGVIVVKKVRQFLKIALPVICGILLERFLLSFD